MRRERLKSPRGARRGASRPRPLFFLGFLAFFLLPSFVSRGPWTAEGSRPPAGNPGPAGHPEEAPLPEPPKPPADAGIQALRGELQQILTSTGNRSGRWGVLATSLDWGDTLLALNPHQPLVPASNVKLLTSAAAFRALGPDFRYTTFLLSTAPVRDDTLEGDLVLYGTGDPTFSSRFYPQETAALDSLAQGVLEAGIRTVRGDLVVDGSYFAGPELHPDWNPEDLNEAFSAPISAMTVNESLVTVRVEAGGWSGARPLIHVTPPGSGLTVVNQVRTVEPEGRSRVWLFRDTPWDPIGMEGEIPVGGRDVWRRLPVPDPLLFSGRLLEEALAARGVEVAGHIRLVRDPGQSILPAPGPRPQASERPRILAIRPSPPLARILGVVNKESNNLLAESVARTLGRHSGRGASFEGGAEAVREFLVEEVGVRAEEVWLEDGSGLSGENRVSAGALVRLLAYMADSPEWEDLWETLPQAGVWREMRRMGGTPAARNLRAKTGTMDGVSALSGMVRTRSGERILFSILSNEVASELRAKRAEDQLGARLASLTRPLPPDPDSGS